MKQQKLSAEKLQKVFQEILDLINQIEDKTSKTAISEMFAEIGDRYFSAPASHRAEYHNCFPGGLADHANRVYTILAGLCSTFNLKIPHDSIIKVALLHDLGKIGDEHGDYYIEQTSDWHRDKLGEFYTINNDIEFFQHHHRSLYMCQLYRIPLTLDEYKAILIHDGQYIDANKAYANKEGLFAILAHMADNMACNVEKENYRKFVGK